MGEPLYTLEDLIKERDFFKRDFEQAIADGDKDEELFNWSMMTEFNKEIESMQNGKSTTD